MSNGDSFIGLGMVSVIFLVDIFFVMVKVIIYNRGKFLVESVIYDLGTGIYIVMI